MTATNDIMVLRFFFDFFKRKYIVTCRCSAVHAKNLKIYSFNISVSADLTGVLRSVGVRPSFCSERTNRLCCDQKLLSVGTRYHHRRRRRRRN